MERVPNLEETIRHVQETLSVLPPKYEAKIDNINLGDVAYFLKELRELRKEPREVTYVAGSENGKPFRPIFYDGPDYHGVDSTKGAVTET